MSLCQLFQGDNCGTSLVMCFGVQNLMPDVFATVDQRLSYLCPGLVDDGIQPSHLTPKVFFPDLLVYFSDDMNTGNPHPDVWENKKTPFKLGKFQKKQHRFDSVPNGGFSAAKSRLAWGFFWFWRGWSINWDMYQPNIPNFMLKNGLFSVSLNVLDPHDNVNNRNHNNNNNNHHNNDHDNDNNNINNNSHKTNKTSCLKVSIRIPST